MDDDASFRWAILGTGPVSRKFAHAIAALPDAMVGTVATRRLEAAQAFSSELGGTATDDFAKAITMADAVYVATPPAMHEMHAMMAIGAGKPVLVEKPFAADGNAARRIAKAARNAEIYCAEAMWTRYQPLMARLKGEVDKGTLGEIRGFDGSFWGAMTPDASTSLFDPARGGGALRHRGVYPLSLARFFCGPIADVTATGRIGETGVDEEIVLSVSHKNGALSTIRASLRVNGMPQGTLYGTNATAYLKGPLYRPTGARITRTRPGSGSPAPRRFEAKRETPRFQALNDKLLTPLKSIRPKGRHLGAQLVGNGYGYEAQALMDAVQKGLTQSSLMPLAESVEIAEVMDAALKQVHL